MKTLTNLLKIKSLITIAFTTVFCYLAITGVINAEMFMTVFSMVVTFYFAKQLTKD